MLCHVLVLFGRRGIQMHAEHTPSILGHLEPGIGAYFEGGLVYSAIADSPLGLLQVSVGGHGEAAAPAPVVVQWQSES